MPRAQEHFIVVTPGDPEQDQPALAMAPGVFLGIEEQKNNLVQLPHTIDGTVLEQGAVVRGMAHIFVRSAAEVRPDELHVLPPEHTLPPALAEDWS